MALRSLHENGDILHMNMNSTLKCRVTEDAAVRL